MDWQSLENLQCGLDGSKYRWVDLDGEGVPGILTEQNAPAAGAGFAAGVDENDQGEGNVLLFPVNEER